MSPPREVEAESREARKLASQRAEAVAPALRWATETAQRAVPTQKWLKTTSKYARWFGGCPIDFCNHGSYVKNVL